MSDREPIGTRKGWRIKGDKRMPDIRMTVHWAHSPLNRMYWCRCAPGFRVGVSYFHPSVQKGRNGWWARQRKEFNTLGTMRARLRRAALADPAAPQEQPR